MASLTQWTWVWVNSGSWWWTGMPGMLRFIRSQRRTRLSDWTELNLWGYNLVLTHLQPPLTFSGQLCKLYTNLHHFGCQYGPMEEKAKAPHSSTLAWKTPWMEEPGRLQSIGSLRVGHGWAASLSLFTFMHWRRKWQPTAVFLPGESQGQGSLVGCCLWGRTESDTTEVT